MLVEVYSCKIFTLGLQLQLWTASQHRVNIIWLYLVWNHLISHKIPSYFLSWFKIVQTPKILPIHRYCTVQIYYSLVLKLSVIWILSEILTFFSVSVRLLYVVTLIESFTSHLFPQSLLLATIEKEKHLTHFQGWQVRISAMCANFLQHYI